MLLGQPVADNCHVEILKDAPTPDTVQSCKAQLSDGRAIIRFTMSLISGAGRAEVVFSGVRAFYLGAPNDEALNGHRLWGRGLAFYSFQEVVNSDWVAELERRNRVHLSHSARNYQGLRHFIITFKEETLECVARGFEVQHRQEETDV